MYALVAPNNQYFQCTDMLFFLLAVCALNVLWTLKVMKLKYKWQKLTSYAHVPIGKVWVYQLLFICMFYCSSVCTITDFSAEDEAISIKFCTAVHQRPRQGITFWGTLLPQKPKIGRIGQLATTTMFTTITLWLPNTWQRTACGHGSACVDIRPSPKTDILVYNSL